jgi:hypothetical protein
VRGKRLQKTMSNRANELVNRETPTTSGGFTSSPGGIRADEDLRVP